MALKRNAEEIFTEAVELSDPAAQEEYLEQACAGDEKLRGEVDALLSWHREAGDFLEVPAVNPRVMLQTSDAEGLGTVIGPYKLLEKLGEGGMATVYMAEQKHPIRRRVALKIIKLGMDTKQVIGRFAIERQALSMMDHPNIAKVFDAGSTDTGRPYFVMELVRGLPITEFCDKNDLTTRERLALFISVCQAVQHAHQRGIIHRDIKPSNVLVTLHDGNPVAKVIDFGIAKAVNQQFTERTVFTRYSQMIGTPEYMSPEQAEMSGLDIDTRTDVFSMGVLLYELLTGTTPFDSDYLLSKGYGEMQRIIREEEPVRPSTKISTMGQALTEIAKRRRTSPEVLCKLIRTDLDWIVMRALEKDRNRRYETAHALADDIRRHLNHQPISAVSAGRLYHLHKFIRRNRSQVILAAWILAVILMVATVGGVLHVRATRRDNARFADGLVQRLLDAQITQVPQVVGNMAPYKRWTEPLLRQAEERAIQHNELDPRLRCALALLSSDPSQASYLFERLFEADPAQLRVIANALNGHAHISVEELWRVAEDEAESPGRRLRAACVLASHDPQDGRWSKIAQPVIETLVVQDILPVGYWKDMLRPQRAHLLAPLEAAFRDHSGERHIRRRIATEVLADLFADHATVLCSLLIDADLEQYRVLLPVLERHGADVADVLACQLHAEMASGLTEESLDELARQKANAAVALVRLGVAEDVWPLLRFAGDPRVRNLLIHRFQFFQVPPVTIIDRLDHEADPEVRVALILALGEYPLENIPEQRATGLIEQFLQSYRSDPEASIHSAVEYTLRRWGQSRVLREVNKQLIGADVEASRRWRVNSQGQTMVTIPGPVEFLMGAGPSVSRQQPWPDPVAIRIDRTFAVATTEVTQQQFSRFLQDYPDVELSSMDVVRDHPDVPIRCTWYQAARYCRWLSEQEGIPEDQMCFPPVSEITEGMRPYPDYLDRTGYRLPSEAEWEYACRAGTVTRYCCGYSRGILKRYGWYHENANGVLHPVGTLAPNDFGLFDVHGNVGEYCYESSEIRKWNGSWAGGICLDEEDTSPLSNDVNRISCGGSFCDAAIKVRVFVRAHSAPHMSSSGIRLVRTLRVDGIGGRIIDTGHPLDPVRR